MQLFGVHGCPCYIRTKVKVFGLQTLTASPALSGASHERSLAKCGHVKNSYDVNTERGGFIDFLVKFS